MPWRVKRWALLKFHCMREPLEIIRSTQTKSLFGKILIIRQSAGNQTLYFSNGVGSSETIREILEKNDIYLIDLNVDFKYWLIGFIEGDGSFIINRNGYLEFKITQSSNDPQILFYIKKELGFGSVSVQDRKSKTHHFRVRDKKGILKLIQIFNGNLLLEKSRDQFEKWVEAFNECYGTSIITKTSQNNEFSLANSWLSGFTDAEGYFTVSILEKSETYNQVLVKYILSQQGELNLLTYISTLVDGKIHCVKSYNSYHMVVNLKKLDKVINYFKLYPLKTKKSIYFQTWMKIYKLVIEKKHLTSDGLVKIRRLKNKLNK